MEFLLDFIRTATSSATLAQVADGLRLLLILLTFLVAVFLVWFLGRDRAVCALPFLSGSTTSHGNWDVVELVDGEMGIWRATCSFAKFVGPVMERLAPRSLRLGVLGS